MAIALLKAISGIGLKTTAFLQSLFLLPFGFLLQAVKGFFPSASPNQRTLPCSTSPSPSPTPHKSDNDVNIDSGGDESVSSSDMTTSSTMPAVSVSHDKKTPASHITPILQRAPASKENRPPLTTPQTDIDAQLINDGLSSLHINGTRKATKTVPTPRQAAGNGTAALRNDGSGKGVMGAGVPAQEPGLAAGASIGNVADGRVTRAPPVPLTHSVSQTSKPREMTTIQLGSETVQIQAQTETPEQAAEKAMHSRFMRDALDMARLALKTNETPVGCVLVYKGRVIAKGMNATNVSRNGTRHAELMAICALLSFSPDTDAAGRDPRREGASARKISNAQPDETSTWGDVDPSDGHLYPYGQKLHSSPRVDRSVITECTLYVTVEPCVMCASLLRQLGIKKVYFGAMNDKFGGTGGVFRIHQNSPYSMASAPPSPGFRNGKGLARPVLERRPASTDAQTDGRTALGDNNEGDIAAPLEPAVLLGDGGNVEHGYEAEGGWGRDEAVTLLRQFYVQENNRAPVPRKKEGRAARLAAMMERDGHIGGPMTPRAANEMQKDQENIGTRTPETEDRAVGSAPESTTS
ncbi:tRNA-specific adenosine deaminase subunit TAD2 [Madurella mycetomatis]|uniref:tRNA-specific adenosine deaminase subunit TAD2 n=1 Tax=Madurella mycetomatis TaxID=100816 RepID=A0A175W1S0_9PEZI|nr:tRNA-specific adenosine deaminase subunit TAD2 [Madurella mycetomatis]